MREEWRERAELFQRPGRLSLHEVNAAGGRLDGNEWYASLGVTTVIGAAVCLQALTHSLVSSCRCWRHTRHFFWNLKASLTICFVIFFLTVGALFLCLCFVHFPRHCDCSSKSNRKLLCRSLVEIRSVSQSCCAKPVDWEAKFKLK